METVVFHSPHPLVPLRPKDGPARPVSWAGFSFEPDDHGINWLPVEAVAEMTESHGMVGVPGAVARLGKTDPRDAEIAALRARVAELETPQHLYGPGVKQATDGGAVRPAIFPPGGEHPLGGPQPALVGEAGSSGSAPSNEVAKSDVAPAAGAGEPAAVDKPKRGKGAGIDVVS